MRIEIDLNSEEAIYIQIRNQVVLGVATSRLCEGDSLPSVRQLADMIGINMHTVNKAYHVLKQEGFITLDNRRGAVVALNHDRMQALEEVRSRMTLILAAASCKNISREEVHALVDEIYEGYC